MAIPKVIYQTFKTDRIPLLTRFYIWRFKRKNPGYTHEFYDDARVDLFVKENFDQDVYAAYSRLQIGAAKADFFRYAVLYIHGGVYLDLDSDILVNLDRELIRPTDEAIIARETNHPQFYLQWALIFDKGHPFLKRTLDYIVQNIESNAYPHDVHAMTGPTVYTRAVEEEMQSNPAAVYREVPSDYKRKLRFKYKLSKLLIYRDKSQHWKKLQQKIPVLRPL